MEIAELGVCFHWMKVYENFCNVVESFKIQYSQNYDIFLTSIFSHISNLFTQLCKESVNEFQLHFEHIL